MNRLYAGQRMPTPEVVEFLGGHAAIYTTARPNDEGRTNQDSALVYAAAAGAGVLAVADGAGGQSGGARASETSLTELQASLAEAGESLREAVLSGFDRANRAVAGFGVGAATTLVLALIQDGRVRAFHAGDSFLLLVGQRGKRKLETIAHSPIGYAMEAGMIGEEEALGHDDLHVVSNMIGFPEMRVEMSAPLPIARRDTLLIASDGVRDNLRVEEIADLVRKGPLERVAARLAAVLAERMAGTDSAAPSKPDDMTFVIYRR